MLCDTGEEVEGKVVDEGNGYVFYTPLSMLASTDRALWLLLVNERISSYTPVEPLKVQRLPRLQVFLQSSFSTQSFYTGT